MRFFLFSLLAFLVIPISSFSQISTPAKPGNERNDTVPAIPSMDADRSDIPFIDYQPGVIWTSSTDSVHDFCRIRKNFTDQLIAVWNHPKRYYPASRVYAVSMGDKYYRAVNTAPQNYVFAQELVKGPMNLYAYRIITQYNGSLEVISGDPDNPGYRNNMIIENEGMRGSYSLYGYCVATEQDSGKLVQVTADHMDSFVSDFLDDSPLAKKEAEKYYKKVNAKARKVIITGIACASVAAIMMGNDVKWLFIVSLPVALAYDQIRKPHQLQLEDMVRIVTVYNAERSGQTLPEN